jgi:O-antigen/teichoic acid export membrane protein
LTATHLRTLTWFATLLLIAILMVVGAFSPLISSSLGVDDFALVIALTAPAALAQPFIVASTAVLRRRHRFRSAFLTSLVAPTIFNASAVAMAFAGLEVYSLVVAQAISYVVNGVVVFLLARVSLVPPRHPRFGGSLQTATSGSSSRAILWVTTNIDTFTVAAVYGTTEVGIYSRAYNINVQLKEPFTIVETMSRQVLASLRAADTLTAEDVGRAFRLLTLFSALVAGSVILGSEGLVLLLLGDQWSEAGWVLALLAAGLPGRVAGNFLDGLAISTGKMSAVLWRAGTTLIMTAFGLVLVAHIGLPWVAFGVTAGVYLGLAIPSRDANDLALSIPTRMRLFAPAASVTAALLVLAIALHISDSDLGSWTQLVLSGVCFVTLGTAALVLLPRSWIPGRGGVLPGPGAARIPWLIRTIRNPRRIRTT